MKQIRYAPIFLALMIFLVTACGNQASESANDAFVGRVEGSEFFVGITAGGGTARAYVCDNQTGAWFNGTVADNQIDLTSPAGARLQATLAEEVATGTFTPAGGQPLSFRADAVPAGSNAGVYRAETDIDGTQYVAGWVVLPNGEQRGATNLADTSLPTLAFTEAGSPTSVIVARRIISPTLVLR